MPQKVGPIRRPDQTSIPHEKNPKQSGVVVVDRDIFACLKYLILSFTCNFFAYFKFHSD